jgi:predicted RNA-binding protein with PIN domain
MPYLVDGHNLIPRLPGLSLTDLEDERALIERLGIFALSKRTQIEVYFDQAPPSRAGRKSFGRIKAHFIREGTTADQAIISRLQRLGKSAQNWTVVSSDRVIAAEARGVRSPVISSEEFAALLSQTITEIQEEVTKGEDPDVSEGEVNYWLDRFQGN